MKIWQKAFLCSAAVAVSFYASAFAAEAVPPAVTEDTENITVSAMQNNSAEDGVIRQETVAAAAEDKSGARAEQTGTEPETLTEEENVSAEEEARPQTITQPADIRFEKNGDMTYIYCNNHEAVRQENVVNLTDAEVPNRSFLMSLEELPAGKYVLFISHINETPYERYEDTEMADSSFEIFLDARFQSYGGANVRVKRAGYWTMPKEYMSWTAMPAWADYFAEDIYQQGMKQGHSMIHETLAKDPLVIQYKNYAPTMMNFVGQTAWLGDYLPGKPAPCMHSKPVFMIAEFEVLGDDNAYINIDIGALKSVNGDIAQSRQIRGNVRKASFVTEYQFKGVSEYAPEVSAQPMDYQIDANTGTLPVTVYNSITGTEGNTLENGEAFFTYGSPKGDTYNMGDRYAGSDMLTFFYEDPDGELHVFGPDNPWDIGGSTTCQTGNFGVITRYTLHLENTTDTARTFVYNITTASNYLVRMRSSSLISESNPNGEYRTAEGYSLIARNEVEYADGDYMSMIKAGTDIVSCPLPAGQVTTVEIEVVSPTNVLGGLENKFIIR